MIDPDPLLSLPALAAALGVTSRSVRDWITAGRCGVRLRYEPVGTRKKVRRSWVEDFSRRVEQARRRRRDELRRLVQEAV